MHPPSMRTSRGRPLWRHAIVAVALAARPSVGSADYALAPSAHDGCFGTLTEISSMDECRRAADALGIQYNNDPNGPLGGQTLGLPVGCVCLAGGGGDADAVLSPNATGKDCDNLRLVEYSMAGWVPSSAHSTICSTTPPRDMLPSALILLLILLLSTGVILVAINAGVSFYNASDDYEEQTSKE